MINSIERSAARFRVLLTFSFLVLVLLGSTHCRRAPALPTGLVTEKAMVVSAREEASAIGVAIL